MKSDVEKLSATRIKMTVELPFDELDSEVEAAYKRIAAQVRSPDSARARFPAQIIDQRFGRGAVLEEVVNAAVPPAYDAAVAETEVMPLGQPQVEVTEIKDGDKIAFMAEVDIRPDFELPEYKGLAVEVAPLEVTDDDIDEQVTLRAKRFGSYSEVERAAAEGDVLLLDLSATAEGKDIEDLARRPCRTRSARTASCPGSTRQSAASPPATRPRSSSPPSSASTRAADCGVGHGGAVRERTMPEIDDELAMVASEFDTLDELKADLRGRLERARLHGAGRRGPRGGPRCSCWTPSRFPLPECGSSPPRSSSTSRTTATPTRTTAPKSSPTPARRSRASS